MKREVLAPKWRLFFSVSKNNQFKVNNETKILAIAHKTIEIETQAVQQLKQLIDVDFFSATEFILNASGRLVVTGIGKSALIARKLVATFNSTGTPALFMHASDAIHGDFGMVQPNDIILCLSKSGETIELKTLLPMIKNLGAKLIAMTSKKDSFLASQSDLLLYTPIETEADPDNLVPTTSTTVQLVMGDALAMSLLGLRGFNKADFAKVHPGGTLGKKLHLRVRDLIARNEKPIVFSTTLIPKVIFEISSKRLGATAVINEQEQLLGIITDGDIRRMLSEYSDFSVLSANQIMTSNPRYISPQHLAEEALDLMRNNSITQLPIVEGHKYLGMIHLHDLLREGIG